MLRSFPFNFKYLRLSYCTITTKPTYEIIKQWKNKFESSEIENPEFNLKCIIAHVVKKKLSALPCIDSIQLNEDQKRRFEQFCQCRMARMPLQYILGEWDFIDLTLKLEPPVFIPRPETESLVQLVINSVNVDKTINFLEIGCGSGAISLSILKAVKNASCVALDSSRLACELAIKNGKSLGLLERISVRQHKVSDNNLLPSDVNSKFDVIVSNPPYIKTADLAKLAPEILYENVSALDGGPDGLNVVRNICRLASIYLKSGGRLWMEIDSSHPPLIGELISTHYSDSLRYCTSYDDIFGKPRIGVCIRTFHSSHDLANCTGKKTEMGFNFLFLFSLI